MSALDFYRLAPCILNLSQFIKISNDLKTKKIYFPIHNKKVKKKNIVFCYYPSISIALRLLITDKKSWLRVH